MYRVAYVQHYLYVVQAVSESHHVMQHVFPVTLVPFVCIMTPVSPLYICNWSTLQEALLHLRFQIAGYAILLLGFWAWLLWIDYNRVSESDTSAAALNGQSN